MLNNLLARGFSEEQAECLIEVIAEDCLVGPEDSIIQW